MHTEHTKDVTGEWHTWFAWRPVRTRWFGWKWLVKLERRRWIGCCDSGWEYFPLETRKGVDSLSTAKNYTNGS